MMAKQRVLEMVVGLNATIDIEDGSTVFKVLIDSPANTVWLANMGHCITNWVYNPFSKVSVWQSLLADMNEGLIDCVDDECDFCHPV